LDAADDGPMTIAPWVRLGPYEIVAPLGAGGMGEVYRARDTRLGRSVALKIISSDIAASPDARARFEREARTVSQLSHPHVCQLHDVGTEDGQAFLVMELLEGDTLAVRLMKGPLPLDATLRYATQIADALDAAHRAGIVHRDLKPGNVMLPKSGLKLLDFGLAKESAAMSETMPTLTSPVSTAGAVAGTIQYMAPEQLAGRGADHRSDIWALGAVIYEMATGERVFRSTPRVISPPALDQLVRTCLADDPEDRWQAARDVVLQLRAIAATPVEVSPARKAWWPWAVAAAAVAVATVSVARVAMAPARTGTPPVRFSVAPPSGHAFWDTLETVPVAMAPDGSRFGFVASDDREQRVWIRSLSEIDATPLAGTEGARSLFWSPDGRSVGVFANGKLKRIDLPNGSPVVLCDVPNGVGVDGAWGASDIVFATVMGDAVYRLPASGGTPVIDRPADKARHERKVGYPSFLSDGRRYVYSIRLENDDGAVMLAEPGRPARPLMSGVTNAQFVEPDYLVYAHEGTLVAQRFDVERAVMIGAPRPIADPVRYFYSTGVARFGASRSGAIAYHSHVDAERLVWFDRSGRESGEVASGLFITLRISPDGGRVAFSRAAPRIGTFDLWVADLGRRTEQRLTSDPQSEVRPVWSPDGSALFFAGGLGTPHIIRKTLATGQDTELGKDAGLQNPEDISADGKTLMFVERTPSFDIFTATADRLDARSPLIKTTFNEYQPRLSPDGRLFAFVSNESGRNEVYVSTYPPSGLKTPVSVAGGTVPRWSRDGKELFFLTSDRRLMAVGVHASPSVAIGQPTPLFALPGRRIWKDYDVAPDGKRFLAIVTDLLGDEQPMTVVTNWRPEGSR